MNKHAVIISCFDHYERMMYWDQGAQDLGYQTTYVAADYSHGAKCPYTCPVKGCKQIHVLPYRKNLSVQRILSHRMFAKELYKFLMQEQPPLIVALIPPNFVTKYLAKFKKKHPECTLIFDVYDLWPESFPSSGIKKILSPLFRIWGNLRNKYLPYADYVTAECQLYFDKLDYHAENCAVIPFSLPAYEGVSQPITPPTDRAQIAYLGSINNIIDIPQITAILNEINKKMPTTLHIIGDGESREELCRSVSETGVDIQFHGKIFDEAEKHHILSQCHFGLNIMKNSVCVGLTMKSVDYLRHGLPLINNIPADTKKYIQTYRAGFHFSSPSQMAEDVVRAIQCDISDIKKNATALYSQHLSASVTQPIHTKTIKHALSLGEKHES